MGYIEFLGNDGDFLIGYNDVDGVVVRSWGIWWKIPPKNCHERVKLMVLMECPTLFNQALWYHGLIWAVWRNMDGEPVRDSATLPVRDKVIGKCPNQNCFGPCTWIKRCWSDRTYQKDVRKASHVLFPSTGQLLSHHGRLGMALRHHLHGGAQPFSLSLWLP